MSEPTTTRAALRRAICRELQMPFARRFAAGVLTMDSGSAVGKLIDATLMQVDKFWNGGWIFIPDTDEISIIRNFASNERSAQLEVPLVSVSDSDGNPFEYEIHTMWNAIEIHSAINRAIEQGGRVFPDTVVDDTLVLQENKLSYSLTSLTRSVMILNKVWIENPGTLIRGQADTGGSDSITVQSIPSNISTSWKVSIYAGKGAGQVSNYASNFGNIITVNPAWSTTPDSTSKYALWDASEEIYDWIPTSLIYTDAKEFPDVVRFRTIFPSHYGCRIRLEYLSIPVALTTEASTVSIPKEYLIPKVCAILHGQKLNDTKADRDLHFAESQRYEQMSEAYVVRNAPHKPDSRIQAQYDFMSIHSPDDPLNWRGI